MSIKLFSYFRILIQIYFLTLYVLPWNGAVLKTACIDLRYEYVRRPLNETNLCNFLLNNLSSEFYVTNEFNSITECTLLVEPKQLALESLHFTEEPFFFLSSINVSGTVYGKCVN